MNKAKKAEMAELVERFSSPRKPKPEQAMDIIQAMRPNASGSWLGVARAKLASMPKADLEQMLIAVLGEPKSHRIR